MNENGYILFCPYCLDLVPIDKSKSLDLLKNYSNNVRKVASECLSSFSKEKIIKDFMNFREITFKDEEAINFNLKRCIISTLIIGDCLKNTSGRNYTNCVPYNFEDLYFFYEKLYFANNSIVEIEEGFSSIFPSSEKLNELIPQIRKISFEFERKEYCYIPKQIWQYYNNTLEFSTLLSSHLRKNHSLFKQIEKNRKTNEKITKLNLKCQRATKWQKKKIYNEIELLKKEKIYSLLEMIYNGFHAVYLDAEIFSFKELQEIDLEGPVSKIIGSLIAYKKGNSIRYEDSPLYYEITFEGFRKICEGCNVNVDMCYDLLVSSEMHCKEFPLLIEINSTIFICPEFLTFIWSFIKFKYNSKSFKDETGTLLGKNFETEVEELFRSQGFRLEHPIHKNNKLTDKKISFNDNSGKNLKFEIDLIPYNDKFIFVVECKRYNLKPNYIYEKERRLRFCGNKGIKDEINNKHIHRINYIKANYGEFGFNSEKEVKGLIVTYVKEEFSNYHGVDVVAFSELSNYLKSFTLTLKILNNKK